MDVLDVLAELTLVSDGVLVEALLPDASDVALCPAGRCLPFRSTGQQVGVGEATLDQADARGVILIVFGDAAEKVEVVGQENHRVDVHWPIAQRSSDGG